MPRFRFKMEPVLKARRHVEYARQRAVAVLERRRQELEDTLRRHQGLISDGKHSVSERLEGTLDLGGLRDQASATIHLMRKAHRIVIELAGVHKQLETARVALREAARDRRAVELLREQRFRAWRAEMSKAEDAALDELAVQRAARKELES